MEETKKTCKNCGTKIERINFTAIMTEQWVWNGETWECCAHNSLIRDSQQNVYCSECDAIIGTGRDFGF